MASLILAAVVFVGLPCFVWFFREVDTCDCGDAGCEVTARLAADPEWQRQMAESAAEYREVDA